MIAIDILIKHHKQLATGIVTLTESGESRSLTFKRGLVTHVESNIREETLGQLLVAEGRITSEQLSEVIKRMLEQNALQGDILIAMGLLSPMEVFECLRKQTQTKLKNCLQMNDCVELINHELNRNNPDFTIPFYRTLIDGLMQYYSPERYKHESGFKRESVPKFTPIGKPNLDKLELNTDEMKLIRAIDGKTNVGEFVGKAHNKRAATALLFLLARLEYISLESNESSGDKLFDTTEEDVAGAPTHAASSVPTKVTAETPATVERAKPTADAAAVPISENSNAMYALLLKLKKKNHFEVLGLPKESPASQIERTYHLLCKQHHLGQIEQFYQGEEIEPAKQLLDAFTLAYSVISDSKRQQAYLNELKKPPTDQSNSQAKPLEATLQAEIENLKAEMYLRFQNPKMALEYANKATQLDPKQADYQVMAAQAQSKLDIQADGKPSKKVEEALRKALELNENSWRALLELGYYYKINQVPDKAETYFRRALERNRKCHPAELELRLIEKRAEKNQKGLFASFRKKS